MLATCLISVNLDTASQLTIDLTEQYHLHLIVYQSWYKHLIQYHDSWLNTNIPDSLLSVPWILNRLNTWFTDIAFRGYYWIPDYWILYYWILYTDLLIILLLLIWCVELSATRNKVPHHTSLWWGPPLESMGATSRIPHLPDTILHWSL